MEGGRANGLLAGATLAGSGGRLICCSACWPQNYKRRDCIPVSQGLQATKATRVPAQGTRADRGDGVLLQRPPRVEGREDTWCHCKALICRCLALKEQSSWEEGDLNRKELSSHKGGPPEGAGCSCCPGGRNREAKPSPPPELAGGKGEIKE